ncbi:hypothetical protein OLN67_19260, partial [Acinetobacter baumannii]|uniref:hypothetical protein n=1 Tax=Acinetobacter baumannii TaxID=470 RepID=UPI0022215E53
MTRSDLLPRFVLEFPLPTPLVTNLNATLSPGPARCSPLGARRPRQHAERLREIGSARGTEAGGRRR